MITVPTIADLFPGARDARTPFEMEIGERFEAAAMPELAALRILDLFDGIRPHPVGAAVSRARDGEWVLILPPGSGHRMHWPWPVDHRDSGVLAVPPLSSGPAEDLHWARLGNSEGRVYSAPLPLYAALPLLASLRPQPEAPRFGRVPACSQSTPTSCEDI
ncbi:hypothetical protein OG883_41505 [Streptomyces sp. NBC_01142]|uniref:hypothetical protein n=1 Tax=Streptomyces sp. NBC_01142 TaxID=2975865 RepID=UPI00224F5A9D|nr:hypothetical protein [Streptomyces sp. NBC_01142]MCX4826150.1 hypothetical protein [Streptomyces sp. NBC_01142]